MDTQERRRRRGHNHADPARFAYLAFAYRAFAHLAFAHLTRLVSAFLGSHLNRLDAKGRVSIPAPFRAALRAGEAPVASLVLRPSHTHPCIEAWPVDAFAQLATPLDGMDVFSEEHDDLAASLYADAYPLESDREGRIVLPEALASHAGLTEGVVFMGLGRIFQLWEPQAAARRKDEARVRTQARKTTLPGQAVPSAQALVGNRAG